MGTITPHNDLFCAVMMRKEHAVSFFKRVMPPKYEEVFHWPTLKIAESKHVGDGGGACYNDILYACETKIGCAYLYLAVEHQSTPEPHMPLRLLKYQVDTIVDYVRQQKETGHGAKVLYPIFLNFVLYHGNNPWSYSTRLGDYYENRNMGEELLYMAPFTLVSLPSGGKLETYKDPKNAFMLVALRCATSKDPYLAFAKMLHDPFLARHFAKLTPALKEMVYTYLVRYIDQKKYNIKDFVSLTADNEREQNTLMTSIAQAYINQGMEKGVRQGIEREKQEVAKALASFAKEGKISQEIMQGILNKI